MAHLRAAVCKSRSLADVPTHPVRLRRVLSAGFRASGAQLLSEVRTRVGTLSEPRAYVSTSAGEPSEDFVVHQDRGNSQVDQLASAAGRTAYGIASDSPLDQDAALLYDGPGIRRRPKRSLMDTLAWFPQNQALDAHHPKPSWWPRWSTESFRPAWTPFLRSGQGSRDPDRFLPRQPQFSDLA